MNLKPGAGNKWKRGSASLSIIALVLAAVLVVNAAVSFICSENLFFIDTSAESIYTLSDGAKNLLSSTFDVLEEERGEENPVKVDLIFCSDPDLLYGNTLMRYIYLTALAMQKAFPKQIEVSVRDVWSNPSSVDEFRATSYSSIYQTSVIVSSGSEFRVYSYREFYKYDSNDTTQQSPAVYSGEQQFLRGILAVTRAEAPLCALTVNHGEPFATEEGRAEYSAFLGVIENAGFDVVYLDLEKEEIPPDCRLIITFDPQTDFSAGFLSGGVSEVSKLEKFLANSYSYMIFADADTPVLPVLEEYLKEWGIAFDRYTTTDALGTALSGRYELVDENTALNSIGTTIVGEYETEGLGGGLTKLMRSDGAPPRVIFENALSIGLSNTYQFSYQLADEEEGTGDYTYGYYEKNSWVREFYDVFTTDDTSFAYAKINGERLTDADGEPLRVNTSGNYRLMTISRQETVRNEGQGYTYVYETTYVCAVGSTAFASNAVLESNAYGNTDALLQTLRYIGQEVVPVGVDFIFLNDFEIDTDYYMTESTTASGTVAQSINPILMASIVALVALPGLIMTGVGVYVLVRRRTRN